VAEGISQDSPLVLFSHPTGNQNVRNAVLGLLEAEMLDRFCTTVAWNPEFCLNRILPTKVRQNLLRRSYAPIPWNAIHIHPWREVLRLASTAMHLKFLSQSEEGIFSEIGMYRAFDRSVAQYLKRRKVEAVYAFEGGALNTFQVAQKRGIKKILELPSALWYWNQRFSREEAERNPDFANLLTILKNLPGHLHWKDEELQLADCIVVPSEHIRQTLLDFLPGKQIQVIPYGAPEVKARRENFSQPGQPLKILFVGSLQQRKGIGYLLRALELLDIPFEFTLVGSKVADNAFVDAACRKYRWFRTRTHEQVLELMSTSDVLVHAALTEGFGLVVTEALASGLPVILTKNAGSSELVEDGRQGFIVPICSAEAIADKLRTLWENRELLPAMSVQAQNTAQAHSWAHYRSEQAAFVKSLLR